MLNYRLLGLTPRVGFLGCVSDKQPACHWRRHKRCGFNLWVRKIPWKGWYGNLCQYSCIEKPMKRGAWQATVHGVLKSRTGLKRFNMHACMHAPPEYMIQEIWGRAQELALLTSYLGILMLMILKSHFKNFL